nr:hypothetical protein [Tanacetum cinerariifolium]
MTTPIITSSIDSQMHNNIMAASSRDRPPMLAIGRYPQWHSRFLRYIDTRPNGEALRKCILSCPYKPTTILVQAIEATDDSPAIPKHTTVETPLNLSPENKAHFEAKKEAIHLILSCKTVIFMFKSRSVKMLCLQLVSKLTGCLDRLERHCILDPAFWFLRFVSFDLVL